MPGFIIKPKPDEDFYVRYSTVADSVTQFGSREELTKSLHSDEADPARFDRADEHGTSALGFEPPYLGWHDTEIQIREGVIDPTEPDGGDVPWSYIKRADLRALCGTLRDGYFHPPAGMLRWEPQP
ncbi:hypothetical protein [Nesterenkonia sandarakina]|uniref:Uncharacterized protein n=1 Tax=Nesterenkonia sandarakina TaxID=272918 RepID=A0A2T0YIY4_9MICC|nr:hypothetical protein [Nesterenkonia sandarakina]PRZ15162.1 hypothetical protein BCL67_10983 [Nesterenkonia sandarakina]